MATEKITSIMEEIKTLTILEMKDPVSYTHLRAHETSLHLVCRLLLPHLRQDRSSVSYTHLTLPTILRV